MKPQPRLTGGRLAALWVSVWLAQAAVAAAEPVLYQLYTSPEHYGILIFPKDYTTPELEDFLVSLDFKSIESGEAVMRFGEKHENMTYMMPPEVQEKHGLKKFIILQILGGQMGIMVGIYEQEYGLTLPPKIFKLEDVKRNIPKTLDQFRVQEGKKRTQAPSMNPRPRAGDRAGVFIAGGALHHAFL